MPTTSHHDDTTPAEEVIGHGIRVTHTDGTVELIPATIRARRAKGPARRTEE